MINGPAPQPFGGFYKDKRVFLTGHTGFKGSWLCLWLHSLGARVTGYALDPHTEPSLFRLCKIDDLVTSVIADVRDGAALARALREAAPEIVIHMAAQPLVRHSFTDPAETYAINVMGTVNLLEAVRQAGTVRALINVTTDKCYENHEWVWGYRENDRLGGYDPYSNSKACSELATSAYRSSFFNPNDHKRHRVGVATARAGNVIGGGDWAADRLIPDCLRAFLKGEKVLIRNPHAVRPWQHVLEPLRGYLMLGRMLYEDGPRYSEAWNFGPDENDAKTVGWITERMCALWGGGASSGSTGGDHPHEAAYLRLDCAKARTVLGWRPVWGLEQALGRIVRWFHSYRDGHDLRSASLQEIREYAQDVHASSGGDPGAGEGPAKT